MMIQKAPAPALALAFLCVMFPAPALNAQTRDALEAQGARSGETLEAPKPESPEIETLLAGFLQNDRELMELAIKLKQAKISRERTIIDNGFDVTLSTGTMKLTLGDEGAFSANPSAELSFPGLNSTSVSVSAQTRTGDASGNGLEDVSARVSTALFSPAGKQRRVDLLKAERSEIEAQRALDKRALTAEKEFYQRLSTLYGYAVQALANEEEAYTKEIDMALTRVQGYAPSSVYYRTTQLEADDKRRAAREQRRVLERELAVFARDCGAAVTDLPQTLPAIAVETLPVFGLEEDKERFTDIESARWSKTIGELSREAQGDLEVKAYTGVTVNNTNTDGASSADAGLSLDWKGTALALGGEFPIGGGNPAFTLSMSFNLNNQRAAALTAREKRLQAESETLAVETAERGWEDTVYTTRREREDLIWERGQLEEQYELYRQLAGDMQRAYEQGIVSESEWRKALTNKESAALKLLAKDIEIRTHLIESALYFVEK